jgi:hypothetical protein
MSIAPELGVEDTEIVVRRVRRLRRHSSRRRHRALRANAIIGFTAIVLALTPFAIVFGLMRAARVSTPAAAAPDLDAAIRRIGDSEIFNRPVYPYSVVPGGVYTTDELVKAASNDPSVADHYHDIALAAMHVEIVDGPRAAYMSYRKDGQIFWTKRKLPLHPGERILTDGDDAVRARCGNRLSDVPMQPTSEVEPAAEELERPEAAPETLLADADSLSPLSAGPGFLGMFGPAGLSSGLGEEEGGPDAFGPMVGGGAFLGDFAAGRNTPDNSTPDQNPPDEFLLPPVDGGDDTPGAGGPPTFDVPGPPGPGDNPGGPGDNPGGPGDNPGGPGDNPGGPGDNPGGPGDTPGGPGDDQPPPSVPEPTMLTLFGTGLVWIAARLRRKS